jgi:dienelactone hydrolase
VATIPPGAARIGMLILQGLEMNRSGVDAVWTRTARALAAAGVAALRVDYPGIADSAGIDGGRSSHRRVLAEVVAWFRAETDVQRIGAIAACYGAKPALFLAAREDLDGPVALVTPALGRGFPPNLAGRVRRRARRRLGRPQPVDRAVLSDLGTVAGQGAVLVLLGDRDRQAAASLDAARRRLGPGVAVVEEVVPDERLQSFPTASGRAEAIARLTRWATSAAPRAALREPG